MKIRSDFVSNSSSSSFIVEVPKEGLKGDKTKITFTVEVSIEDDASLMPIGNETDEELKNMAEGFLEETKYLDDCEYKTVDALIKLMKEGKGIVYCSTDRDTMCAIGGESDEGYSMVGYSCD